MLILVDLAMNNPLAMINYHARIDPNVQVEVETGGERRLVSPRGTPFVKIRPSS
jgi:hypothetical protein